MGFDASCTLTIDGRTFRGTALLEQKDLVFRGPLRLVIPFSTISHVAATGSVLEVRFGERAASFDIGALAARWARRIANPPSRLDKLGVKAGMLVALVGLNDDVFADELETRGARISRRVPPRARPAHVIFYKATSREALDRLASLVPVMRPDGALWVVRPKGSASITESETMAAGRRAGLVDVKVVSFSDTHTAEKFVIPLARRPSGSGPKRAAAQRRR